MGRTCRACLWMDGAVRPPAEAGTHRVESGSGLNAVGIPALQRGEDVNVVL